MEIIEEINLDHDHLRSWIQELESEDSALSRKKAVFARFVTFLEAHKEAEEKTVYAWSRKKSSLKHHVLESQEEHSTADALVKKAKLSHDSQHWKARVKVLCDIVKHHLDEEEKEFWPKLRKEMTSTVNRQLGKKYRAQMEKNKNVDWNQKPIRLPISHPLPPPLEAFIP